MDPLSNLLRTIRLEGSYFYAVEAIAPWSVEAAPARELSPRIMPQSEHLIAYHIVTDGGCYAGLNEADQVELNAGDVIVFPHGDRHVVSSRAGMQSLGHIDAAPTRFPGTVVLGEGECADTRLVCGFLGCDLRPFNPLLTALPRQMHVRGMSDTGLGQFTRQLTTEARRGRAGADTVLTRLAEVMFVDVLRRYLDELPSDRTGWLAGLRDPGVGPALALIHARPAFNWTLIDLAREAATSRSMLAERFTAMVGQPPMAYLAQWRMQVAANLLSQSGAKISSIATDVGYDSEAAFSRAFKRATGESPGAFRQHRQSTAR